MAAPDAFGATRTRGWGCPAWACVRRHRIVCPPGCLLLLLLQKPELYAAMPVLAAPDGGGDDDGGKAMAEAGSGDWSAGGSGGVDHLLLSTLPFLEDLRSYTFPSFAEGKR